MLTSCLKSQTLYLTTTDPSRKVRRMGPFCTTAGFGRWVWNQPQRDLAARGISPSCISREMLQRLSVSQQYFSLLERREAEAILEAEFKDLARDCLDFFAGWCAFLADLCMSSIHGYKGTPAATSLCLARSLPCIPLCTPSKE